MTDETTVVTEETTIPENLKALYALQGKNAGCSLQLRGKVVLISFLINDGESSWTTDAETAFRDMMKSFCDELMAESGLNKSQLQVAYATCQVNIPYKVDRTTNKECIYDVLRQFGYHTPHEYQAHYEEKFHRDEAVISLVFNKDFRSYAISCSTPADTSADEISYISFNAGDLQGSKRSYKHELMHQFGAIDYYYPEYMRLMAKKHFPDSVMDSGSTVDPLTRYIIGWEENPAKDAIAFLEDIQNIPPEEIEHAKTMQWIK